MTLKRTALYLIICFFAALLLTRGWANFYVEDGSESARYATLIAGPMVQIGNTDGVTSMVISWRTVGKADSRIDYGESALYGKNVMAHERTDRHAVLLTDLQPNQQYFYQIASDNQILAKAVFQTGKVDDATFKFAVFGDSGSVKVFGPHPVSQQVEQASVDFVLHTGDVVYPNGEDENYPPRFYRPFKNLVARVPFFPAIGNHDIKTANGQPWLDNFVLPGKERFYSFSYANAFFVALDSYNVDRHSARWLEAQLAGTDKLWKFIFFHEPPFSNHKNRAGSSAARSLWVPLFNKYKVDVVFSGHDHMYTRFARKNGVAYIVEGVGGHSLQEINPQAKDVVFTSNREYGFGLVEVAGAKLTFRHVTATGAVLDTFTLAKPSVAASLDR